MNNSSVISIITPSYNQGEYIEDTILSVCTQKGSFFIDYIIVDNESTDQSFDKILKYYQIINKGKLVNKIKNVKFYQCQSKTLKTTCKGISLRYLHEKDTGHGNGLNKGFSLAIGDVLAWINSDDKYHPGAFQAVNEIFNKFPNIKWLMGRPTWYNQNGQCTGEGKIYKNIYDFLNNDYQWIQQESTFWRKKLWTETGGQINENYKLMVDGELWCRFFKKTELYHLDRVLGGYRSHETNRANIYMDKVIEEMNKAISELRNDIDIKTIKLSKKLLMPIENIASDKDILNLNYKLITKNRNDQWIIKKLNYLIIKQFYLIDKLKFENQNLKNNTSLNPQNRNSSIILHKIKKILKKITLKLDYKN